MFWVGTQESLGEAQEGPLVPVLALLRPMGGSRRSRGCRGRLQHRGRAGVSPLSSPVARGRLKKQSRGAG